MKIRRKNEVRNTYSFEGSLVPVFKKNSVDKQEKDIPCLDLNETLAPVAENVFIVQVSGDSMIDSSIFDGDFLIVDRSIQPVSGNIVIAAINGEMAVKHLKEENGKLYLVSANKRFLPIEIFPYMSFEIQGVVKHVIHRLHK